MLEPYNLPSVLIVDDDKDFAEEISETLQNQGWNSQPTTSVADALVCIEDKALNIGVVISDVYMPEANGVRLAREIQARPSDERPEVILISGHRDIETVTAALKLQVVDFLSKPVRSGELVSAVEHAVDRLRDRHTGGVTTTEPASPLRAQKVDTHIDPLKLLLDINQLAADHLAKDQLDHQQIRILIDTAWHLRHNKQVTVTGLSYGLNVPLATTHRKLRGLELCELIERVPDESDRRLTYIRLTEEGNLTVDRLTEQVLKKLSQSKV